MANNLLVDWLNNKKKNVQTNVLRKSATNTNNVTTPNLPIKPTTVSQTGLNLQKAQQPVQTRLNNINTQTAPIQTNTGVGSIAQTPNQSRFIGFQQQQPQAKSFNKLMNNEYLMIPTAVNQANFANAKEENRYRTMSEAFYDLQGTLYKRGNTLKENELRQKFPEFKDLDINVLNELQNELLPIVRDGKGVDADQISQIYPELLKGKELKDIEKIKENIDINNKKLQQIQTNIDKTLKTNWQSLSPNGMKYIQNWNTVLKTLDEAKKQGVVGGASNAEIIDYLAKNNPEFNNIFKELNGLELSEMDKAIVGKKDASLLKQVQNKMSQILIDQVTNSEKPTDEEIESVMRGKEKLENDFWGQTGKKIATEIGVPVDSLEKFTYRTYKDIQNKILETGMEYTKDYAKKELKSAFKEGLGVDLTDEQLNSIDNLYNKAVAPSINEQIKINKQNVMDYAESVNKEYESRKTRNLDPDIENYVNNMGMTRSLLQGNLEAFGYKSAGDMAQNADMLVTTALGVVAPEVVLPLMAVDSYSRESQESFEELMETQKKMGISQDEAYDNAKKGSVIVGLASATVELALEKLIGGVETTASKAWHDAFTKEFTKKATEMMTERGLADILKQGATTQFKASLEEGLEEVLQQTIHNKAIQQYDPDQKLTEGLLQAFEGGFYNPMNLLAGGGDVFSNIDTNSIKQGVNNTVDNATARARNIVGNVQQSVNNGVNNVRDFMNRKNKVTSQNAGGNTETQLQGEQTNISSENVNKGNNTSINVQNNNIKSTNGAIELEEDTTENKKTAIKEGGLGEKVLESLNGLDENTRERIKKNPYSVEESKNLIKEMDENPGIDFRDYQNGRYEEVLDTVLKKLEQKENKRSKDIGTLYDKLEEANAPVDVTELKNKVAEFQAQAEALEDIATPAEQAQIKTILENIEKIGDGTMDVWKVRKIADKRSKRSASSSYDGIGLIWDIRDAIDDVIVKGNPDMKEVDKSYSKVLKEIGEIKGKLFYKNGGLKSNAVSTIKNMMNAGNRIDLNNLEKYIPGIKKQLQAIDDSKFVYNAYTTGKGSRFISGIARGVFGNIGKAIGFFTGGWGGLVAGAVVDAGVDTALVKLTRKALRDTITKETAASRAELERISKKIEEGEKLDAEDKARLKELGEKIKRNGEQMAKTKAEKEAWIKMMDENITPQTTEEEQEKNKVTKKKTTKKNKVTEKNNEAKNKVTKKEPVKKAETTEYINETPQNERGQLEEIEAEENLRNNETPQRDMVEETPKNKVTSKKAEATAPKQEENQTTKIVDKNGNPKTVYHYSDTDFKEFDLSKQKNKLGIYFSPSSKPNSKLRKYRINATINMQNPLTISPNNKSSQIYPELKQYISDKRETEYDTKFRELLIRDGYDGVIMEDEKGNVSQYVVLYPEQVNIKSQGPIKGTEENVVTDKAKVTEKKAEAKPVENSELREKIGDRFYDYLQKQVDIINENRKEFGKEPITVEDLNLNDELYINKFEKIAQEELSEIQNELSEINKDLPQAPALTDNQREQLNKAENQTERNKLLRKWQDEWLENNPISEEKAEQIREIMERAADIIEQHNKARNYIYDSQIAEENKENEDHYSEESKTKITDTAKNKVTNITVTKGGNITPDNSGITGRFRNLTAEEYNDMKEMGGLEKLYQQGKTDTIFRMQDLKEVVNAMIDLTVYGLPEDFNIDYHDFTTQSNGQSIVEIQQILDKLEAGEDTKEFEDVYGDHMVEKKDGTYEWDVEELKRLQRDYIGNMLDWAYEMAYGEEKEVDRKLVDQIQGDLEGVKMDSYDIKKTEKMIDKMKELVKKYGEYWHQGNSNDQWNTYVRYATDIDNLDNNETAQIPTIFEEDLEQMNLRGLQDNETPQDIDYQDLAELENETPQMLEEESTNKVTSNSRNKVTNGGTNLDKAIEIIKNADATKPQQGYIGEDTYARASSSDVVIKTKGDTDFNQISFYRKSVSLSEMAQNDTMFIVLNDVGEKGIENVNKVLEGFDLQYRVGSELDNRGDTVYYLENTNTGHKDYFSDEGRSEPALSKTLRDKTIVPRFTPEQQAEYDRKMEQRRKEQEAEREKERQEEEKRKEEEAKRLEEENTRKANLLTYVNDTYGDNPLQRGRVLKELSELNEESDHKIHYYGDEVPDNAEVWQVLDALADFNGTFSETRESGDNYTWTYNYGDNRSINRLTKAQKNYLEYRMNIKPVQNRLQNYLDNIENKSLRTRTENVLSKKERWKLDDGKIVTWTKAQYIEWLVNDLGYRPKEFPTGKTYANGEPKIDYMIVNEKNAGYISSKIENGYAKSLLETPEEELSAEDEAKLEKELFNKKSDNSDYESRIIKDNSNYKFEDLKDADIETILSKDGFEKYTFEEDGQKGEGYAGYINGKAVDIIPNKEKNRITINVGDELFRSYDDGSINVQLNGSDEITQTSSVYDNEVFKGTLARALGTEYKALGEPKSYKYDKDNGVFAIYDKSDSDKILYEVSLGDKVMFDDGTIYDTAKHLGAGKTQAGEKHFDNKPVTEIFAGKTLIGISKGNKYASNKYTDTRAQGAVLKDMESIQELEWLLEDKNNILVGEIDGTPVKVSALDLNYNPIKMENVGKDDDYYNKVKTYKLQVGKNTDNTYFYDTFPELKSALKRIYVGEDVNKTTTEVTGEKNAVTAKQVENEKPKNLVTSRIENTKQEIQEIDKDTYFDDIVKNLKDHPREMFIYKDGNYFYPHYILPSGKVITPENTYWGEVSSEEAARNWLLKEAEEHSEENETKKAEKLKEIVGKTAEKYEATLKRIESDNPMQEIWTSGDYFKYGMGNNQMARAKKESEANAEVGTFKKDVIDGKEGYRIFVAGTKNEAIRAFYEPKTGKTYRIYRGPVIDDSKPYTTKQVERIEKFLENVDKQLDKETKKEKVEKKDAITQEWLDSLTPDKDGVIELPSNAKERYALKQGKETLIKEGKADGKYLYNYATPSSPQYGVIYIKDGNVYNSMDGLDGNAMKTKQDAIDWLNEKEKDVKHEATERYNETDYETLPKTISVEEEGEKAGPKRIAPNRVKWQQETYEKGLENVKDIIKQKRVVFSDLGFKSLRGKAVKNIRDEITRIRQLPESEAEKQYTELAKSIYEDLVIKDISKGYRYPEDVTSKFPKAQMKKAVDARARYEKGLFTSFSAKDTRANNQYRDEIGAGIKSQDGKPVTQEQMNEIVDGIRAYSNIFGVDMKKFAEDNNVIYVHLHGGNPFLMGGMSIAGLYRRDAAGNISVSLGGREGVMEKGEDGKMKKSDIKTTTVHEITHAVDGMLEGKLFSDADTEILKKTMNKPSELINYYNRKQEIVARAVEQYAAHQLGKKLYRTALANIDWENGSVEFVEKEANYVDREAYWNQENFDKYVKPIVEKNMKEKMKDYMLENTRKNVLANDKNKITSK